MTARLDGPALKRMRRAGATAFGRVVAFAAERVSERRALAFGRAAGRVFWWMLPGRRRRARSHVRIAFPDWDHARVDATARASYEELGRSLAEWARLPTVSPDELLARIEWRGLHHLEAALAPGRGALFVTAHYGNWELLPAIFRALRPDVELVVVGRHYDDATLQAFIERRRELLGGELLRPAARDILRALRRGAVVGLLVDLYTSKRRGGILVPFFGRRAWTTPGPATLSLRTGAPILPVWIRRLEGPRHRVEFAPPLVPAADDDRERAIRETTERLTGIFEAVIRDEPIPWLWMHRRWKRSPDVVRD
jgi:KDO2-lipid IV(A) lauroyltransferase